MIIPTAMSTTLPLTAKALNFGDLAVTLKAAQGDIPAVVLAYGKFIQSIIDFVIIAFAIFMGVKAINRLKREEAVAPTLPPVPTKEEEQEWEQEQESSEISLQGDDFGKY